MKSFALGFALAALLDGAAVAQGTPAMTMNVRPSGYEGSDEARAREARLQKRMQEADYLLRNICIQCGGGIDRPGAYGPVDPVATLGASK